jgi:hypothetical protein
MIKEQSPEGGNIVRMRGRELNSFNPVGPGIKKGSYDPAITYVVTLDPNGVPQAAKEAGAGYEEGGEVSRETPGEDMGETQEYGSEENMKSGTFDDYKDKGVSEDLVKRGNDLADRIQEVADSGDSDQAKSFMQEAKDFVSAIESERDAAMQTGDPELMRALKEMVGDAKDLQASIENILSESSIGMNDIENDPEGAMRRMDMNKVVS